MCVLNVYGYKCFQLSTVTAHSHALPYPQWQLSATCPHICSDSSCFTSQYNPNMLCLGKLYYIWDLSCHLLKFKCVTIAHFNRSGFRNPSYSQTNLCPPSGLFSFYLFHSTGSSLMNNKVLVSWSAYKNHSFKEELTGTKSSWCQEAMLSTPLKSNIIIYQNQTCNWHFFQNYSCETKGALQIQQLDLFNKISIVISHLSLRKFSFCPGLNLAQ